MDSESASQEAIRSLNGKHDFHGRKMKVSWFLINIPEFKPFGGSVKGVVGG